MRVAVLIQGEPRFCKEFDTFLEKTVGHTTIDWFFYMWGESPPTSNLVGGSGHIVVAPEWRNITKEWAIEKLRANLPPEHNIVALELADQNLIVHEPVTNNFAQETIQSNVWKMWYSQYQVNQLRVKHEQENNFKYDIVIRTRPDVGLLNKLDLEETLTKLTNEKDLILMPNNRACGYGVWACDLFGMSSSDNMTVYCDIYNQALSHHSAGIIFHPETMLSHHISRNNLRYWIGNFGVQFRDLGVWENNDTKERFDSKSVKTWNNHIYISDFSRWA